eukprot:GHVU01007510.1.p2 GENE.GHVU01007510.1~~GHVU01007510.1.p2  ORF type:complete len:135 (+),score=38.24 GHVU01007510.1:107-511(+)
MTESERTEDDARLDALHPQRQKKTAYTFMQKYYHVGAYFQDKGQDGQDGIYSRNYNEPVGEDALDKAKMPKPMQLRRGQWGKKSQVKHTHLSAVDTTDFKAPWSQTNQATLKYNSKMAGTKAAHNLTRPTRKKS